MGSNIVLYHRGCPDGLMAAAIAQHALRGECSIVPATYEYPIEKFLPIELATWASVYVLDFSFPLSDLRRVAAVAERVVVLDHHATGAKVMLGRVLDEEVPEIRHCECGEQGSALHSVDITVDLNRSGASLAWRYFYPDLADDLPAIVRHVEDYDLWRHRLQDSRAVHAYLRSLGENVADYMPLIGASTGGAIMEQMVTEGRAIQRADRQRVDAAISKADPVTLETYSQGDVVCFAANSPSHQDDIGAALGRKCPSGVGVVWWWRDGRYRVSLRSQSVDGRAPVDVSRIAEEYEGGGGHKCAASFSCAALPFTLRARDGK